MNIAKLGIRVFLAPDKRKAAADIILDLVVLPYGTIVELPGPHRELPRNRPRLHSASTYAWTTRTGWIILDSSDLYPIP